MATRSDRDLPAHPTKVGPDYGPSREPEREITKEATSQNVDPEDWTTISSSGPSGTPDKGKGSLWVKVP